MIFEIRDARDEDGPALITIIGDAFTDYPGCVLDVDGEMPELRAIASSFQRIGGRFWVAAAGERVVGGVGLSPSVAPPRDLAPPLDLTPPAPAGVELRKLYVDRGERRAGIGRALCERVEREARARGAAFVELWTDTRFETAHKLYEARGYVAGRRGGDRITRELHDLSGSVEYYYRLALG
jgi:putative acetyltransferase